MSWISLDDAVQALQQALVDNSLQGPVNVTAPEPLSNRDFTRTLGRVLSRPALFAVPGWALRLALGDMADGTILSSIRAVPARLLQAGYRFGQPDLESALRHVLQKDGRDNFPP
jgi:NAD dependent epimerase/dehydratase family enzyme